LGGLDDLLSRGEFGPLLQWLRDRIHARGQCYSAAELADTVTGKPLTHRPLLNLLRRKFEPLYGM
jgi:carboxypeptidase Taq